MLNFMRKNANSWFITLIFGVLIFIFATNFGGPWVGAKMNQDTSYAALVNNKVISMADFRTAYASQFARIKQFRPDYDEAQGEKDGIKQLIIDQLIIRELLRQMGEEHDLRISPKTLAEQIKKRVFKEDEEFDKEEYKRRVSSYLQISIPQFEEQIAKELLAEQMVNALSTSVYVSDQEAKDEFINKNSKVSIEYVKADPRFFSVDKKFTEADKKDYIEKNKEKINQYYEKNITQYVKDDQIKASHILMKLDPKGTEEEKKSKHEKALKLLDRLKAGEDFATIAKAESEDLGTKEKGGDLDYFSRKMMVEPFSNAAFALNVGQISQVVESPFGFHIIKVFDKKEGQKTTLEQAQNEIALKLLEKEEQEKKAKEYASEALALMSKGINLDKIIKKDNQEMNISPFKPVADEILKLNKSSSYIPKIGKGPELINKAFSLKTPGQTYKDVIFSNEQFYAIRLKEKEDADLSKFDSEKESIKTRLAYPRKRAFVQQYLEGLKKNAKITYNKSIMTNPKENI